MSQITLRKALPAIKYLVLNSIIYDEGDEDIEEALSPIVNFLKQQHVKISNDFPRLKTYDIIEVFGNKEMRYSLNDEFEQFDGIVHPDEDCEFNEKDITAVWREIGDNFIKIYSKT